MDFVCAIWLSFWLHRKFEQLLGRSHKTKQQRTKCDKNKKQTSLDFPNQYSVLGCECVCALIENQLGTLQLENGSFGFAFR